MYFITVCAHEKRSIFGSVIDGVSQLNSLGRIVNEEWLRTAALRPWVGLDSYVVMPNHFHGIFEIMPGRATRRVAPTTLASNSVGAIVGQFKSAAGRRINAIRGTPGAPVWQRNYFERIVRGERELEALRDYISENPRKWSSDRFYVT